MKKVLLGTTAMMAAVMMADTAAAQLDVRVQGVVFFRAGYGSVDGGDDGADFRSDAEVQFIATGTADNGLRYGATVDLDTSTSDQFNADETFLFIEGGWGRITFGDDDSPIDDIDQFASTVGRGQGADGAGTTGPFLGGIQRSFNAVRYSADATKIAYQTPVFSGFRVVGSYSPFQDGAGACGRGEAVGVPDRPDCDGRRDIIEAGAIYSDTIGDFRVNVSAVYSHANALGAGRDDQNDWAIGTRIGFGQFAVGGNFVMRDGNGLDEDWGWSIGALYCARPVGAAATCGGGAPWGVAASYLFNEIGEEDVHTYGVGGFYVLAPGLTLSGDILGFENHTGGADGWGTVVEIRAAF